MVFADSANIVEAAQVLGISQPALSAHLKQLEELLPQRIFAQIGRKKTLTRYGADLVSALKQRFEGIEELIETVNNRHVSETDAHLRIGARKEIIRRVSLGVHFNGHLHFTDMHGTTAAQWVAKGQLDLAIANYQPDSLSLVARKLFRDSFKVIVPKSWKLTHKSLSKALIEDLAARPFLSYTDPHPSLFEVFKHVSVQADIDARIKISDWPVLIQLVSRGDGWTIAPDSFFESTRSFATFDIPQNVVPPNDFYLIMRKDDLEIEWFKRMITDLTDSFKAPSES